MGRPSAGDHINEDPSSRFSVNPRAITQRDMLSKPLEGGARGILIKCLNLLCWLLYMQTSSTQRSWDDGALLFISGGIFVMWGPAHPGLHQPRPGLHSKNAWGSSNVSFDTQQWKSWSSCYFLLIVLSLIKAKLKQSRRRQCADEETWRGHTEISYHGWEGGTAM